MHLAILKTACLSNVIAFNHQANTKGGLLAMQVGLCQG